MAKTIQSWSPWALCAAAAALLAFGLGVYGSNRHSLWFDELYDVMATRRSIRSLADLSFGHELHQVVYLFLLKLWLVVSQAGWWARLLSAALAAAATVTTYAVGRRMFDGATGAIAALVFALNGYVVEWSQQARGYTLLALAAAMTTLLFLRAIERPTGGRWAAYVAVAILSLYCHFFAVFVIVAHAVALPFIPRHPPRRLIVPAMIAIGVGALPIAWFIAFSDAGQVDWLSKPAVSDVAHMLVQVGGSSYKVVPVVACTGLLVLLVRCAPGDTWKPVLLVTWILSPALIGLAVSEVKPVLHSRYLIVVAPAVALLVAVAIRRIPWAPAQLAVLAVLIASSLPRIDQAYALNREDWRGAVAFVSARAAPGDPIGILQGGDRFAFDYYGDPARATTTPSGDSIWLVIRAYDDAGANAMARSVLDGKYRLAYLGSFGNGVRVEHWLRAR